MSILCAEQLPRISHVCHTCLGNLVDRLSSGRSNKSMPDIAGWLLRAAGSTRPSKVPDVCHFVSNSPSATLKWVLAGALAQGERVCVAGERRDAADPPLWFSLII